MTHYWRDACPSPWLNYSPGEPRGLFQLPGFQSSLLKEKSVTFYSHKLMTCFYGYSEQPGGWRAVWVLLTQRQGLVCADEPRLNGPAVTIMGGILHNHSHYCTNTHLGSSCKAAMGDHKNISSWHTSRAEFQQTAVRPASAVASPPLCVTFVSMVSSSHCHLVSPCYDQCEEAKWQIQWPISKHTWTRGQQQTIQTLWWCWCRTEPADPNRLQTEQWAPLSRNPRAPVHCKHAFTISRC